MSERRRGLGRGLGALIPQAPLVAPTDRAAAGGLRSPVDLLIPGRTEPAGAQEPGSPTGPSGGAASGDRPADADDLGPPESRPVEVSAQAEEPAREGAQEAASEGGPTTVPAYFAEVPVDRIRPNPRQPRQVFDEDELAELAASIREVGLLQPVVLRATGAEDYELVMGERRWRAAHAAGLDRLPAIVRATSDDALLRDALLENLHRSQLNPLEEAAAYDQLLQDFGCTHEELAGRIGRSRPQITNTLRLLRLPPLVQRRVAAGVLSAGHARALLALPDPAAQERLAQRIVAEGLSVRAVEEIVAVGGAAEDSRPGHARRRSGRAPVAPALEELAGRLSEHFDTRVRVDLGRRRGKIVVEFASVEDLERIIGLMTPDPAPAEDEDVSAPPLAG